MADQPGSRTQRARALSRARVAFEAGRPHQALEILDQAGMRGHWRTFIRAATKRARRRFLASMPDVSRETE